MSASPTSKDVRHASPATRKSPAAYTVSPLLLPVSGHLSQDEPRRSSIQFLPHRNGSLPRGSPKSREKRRLSSPPPPPVFRPRVSFDTFDKPADFIEESSFTLIAKHKDYEYTKRSRTFLCGFDENEYSVYALQWLINELVDDGDEIVCLRVVEKEDAIAGDRSVETGRYRTEADTTMRDIQSRNHDNKAINLILEFSVGKVNKVIDDMINLYEPAILVVGTRGKSLGGFQGLLPGSVSKYCLQHSPVPVIVVRPTSKRDKARSKRANDPDRQGYRDILAKSESLLDVNSPRNSFFANDEEATAVGANSSVHKPSVDSHPLAQVAHADDSDDDDDAGTHTLVDTLIDDMRGPRSPAVLMKSPHLQNLDSPDLSSEASSSDEEDHGGVSTNTAASGVEDLSPGSVGVDATSYVDNLTKVVKSEEPQHEPAAQKDSAGT
ncbi:adenine nucleotide alpha hydrolases-like protein [Cucurbitaria berberidis CBS 394.84]|uniref:Adenine nucleotide alpha hydrolases-like protein n=1 Tax=Cucurbitaria berberidis CBS 394.84 TaxID=1168544 RepID=A0A9P4GAP0_9PLEO|nr:adenine nucleotide alpha hydrolases-like protein [Cucurbitaria berberidis CBS 394.84]KAF1842132.1 adenine nucleotide alpha hydrolases-like protein [Cucurbitaria berberidis CBS 394.84]